jgi:hypothetical protein
MITDTHWLEPLPGACIVQSHQWKTTAGRRRNKDVKEDNRVREMIFEESARITYL